MFRLKEMRLAAGLKRSELAKNLRINQNTLANYENETREAPYATLIRLADYFDESVDYLLGADMKDSAASDSVVPLKSYVLSKQEKALIDTYRSLNAKGKGRISEYAGMLKNSDAFGESVSEEDNSHEL